MTAPTSRSVIFLDPSVLSDTLNSNEVCKSQYFNEKALCRLEKLIDRIENVAIVFIDKCSGKFPPCVLRNAARFPPPREELDQLKTNYKDFKFGEYIIGKMDRSEGDDLGSIARTWFWLNQDWLSIRSLVILTNESVTDCPKRVVQIKTAILSKSDVDAAYQVLQKPLELDEMRREPAPTSSYYSKWGCKIS